MSFVPDERISIHTLSEEELQKKVHHADIINVLKADRQQRVTLARDITADTIIEGGSVTTQTYVVELVSELIKSRKVRSIGGAGAALASDSVYGGHKPSRFCGLIQSTLSATNESDSNDATQSTKVKGLGNKRFDPRLSNSSCGTLNNIERPLFSLFSSHFLIFDTSISINDRIYFYMTVSSLCGVVPPHESYITSQAPNLTTVYKGFKGQGSDPNHIIPTINTSEEPVVVLTSRSSCWCIPKGSLDSEGDEVTDEFNNYNDVSSDEEVDTLHSKRKDNFKNLILQEKGLNVYSLDQPAPSPRIATIIDPRDLINLNCISLCEIRLISDIRHPAYRQYGLFARTHRRLPITTIQRSDGSSSVQLVNTVLTDVNVSHINPGAFITSYSGIVQFPSQAPNSQTYTMAYGFKKALNAGGTVVTPYSAFSTPVALSFNEDRCNGKKNNRKRGHVTSSPVLSAASYRRAQAILSLTKQKEQKEKEEQWRIKKRLKFAELKANSGVANEEAPNSDIHSDEENEESGSDPWDNHGDEIDCKYDDGDGILHDQQLEIDAEFMGNHARFVNDPRGVMLLPNTAAYQRNVRNIHQAVGNLMMGGRSVDLEDSSSSSLNGHFFNDSVCPAVANVEAVFRVSSLGEQFCALLAKRKIYPGDELLLDYGDAHQLCSSPWSVSNDALVDHDECGMGLLVHTASTINTQEESPRSHSGLVSVGRYKRRRQRILGTTISFEDICSPTYGSQISLTRPRYEPIDKVPALIFRSPQRCIEELDDSVFHDQLSEITNPALRTIVVEALMGETTIPAACVIDNGILVHGALYLFWQCTECLSWQPTAPPDGKECPNPTQPIGIMYCTCCGSPRSPDCPLVASQLLCPPSESTAPDTTKLLHSSLFQTFSTELREEIETIAQRLFSFSNSTQAAASETKSSKNTLLIRTTDSDARRQTQANHTHSSSIPCQQWPNELPYISWHIWNPLITLFTVLHHSRPVEESRFVESGVTSSSLIWDDQCGPLKFQHILNRKCDTEQITSIEHIINHLDPLSPTVGNTAGSTPFMISGSSRGPLGAPALRVPMGRGFVLQRGIFVREVSEVILQEVIMSSNIPQQSSPWRSGEVPLASVRKMQIIPQLSQQHLHQSCRTPSKTEVAKYIQRETMLIGEEIDFLAGESSSKKIPSEQHNDHIQTYTYPTKSLASALSKGRQNGNESALYAALLQKYKNSCKPRNSVEISTNPRVVVSQKKIFEDKSTNQREILVNRLGVFSSRSFQRGEEVCVVGGIIRCRTKLSATSIEAPNLKRSVSSIPHDYYLGDTIPSTFIRERGRFWFRITLPSSEMHESADKEWLLEPTNEINYLQFVKEGFTSEQHKSTSTQCPIAHNIRFKVCIESTGCVYYAAYALRAIAAGEELVADISDAIFF